jgi:hypothetical protein
MIKRAASDSKISSKIFPKKSNIRNTVLSLSSQNPIVDPPNNWEQPTVLTSTILCTSMKLP